jgi:hypothetical protein
MVIVGSITLRDPNGNGRVEVRVSHNVAPGSRYEADRAFDVVRTALLDQVGAEDLTIEYPGVWGE